MILAPGGVNLMERWGICRSCDGLGYIETKDLILHTTAKHPCGMCDETGHSSDAIEKLDKEFWEDQQAMGEWEHG